MKTKAADSIESAEGAASSRTVVSREEHVTATARRLRKTRLRLGPWQVAVVVVFLACGIGTRLRVLVKNANIFDPFFVSRPSQIVSRFYDWTLGAKAGYLWPHLWSTLGATMIGLVMAVVSGFFCWPFSSAKSAN